MKLVQLDPLTIKRLRKFRRLRRGYVALWLLALAYLASQFAPVIANNRPIVISYKGDLSFPALGDLLRWRPQRYYSQTLFGGTLDMETDFRALAESPEFQADGWMVMPPHPFSALESIRVKGDPPPSRPSWRHPMGTDDRGRDIMTRLIYGFQISMSFALALAGVGLVTGIAVGAVQGYFGGWVDLLFQRIEEIWAALPFLYVVTLISSIITPNFWTLLLVLALFEWLGVTRYVRAEVLRERNLDYVTAARALGASTTRVLFHHILGNAMTSVITLAPFLVSGGIFFLSSLDFLGFGLPPPTPSWGELFQQGRGQITSHWLITSPFSALFATLLLMTFVGEAVRDAWDPKEYHRRED